MITFLEAYLINNFHNKLYTLYIEMKEIGLYERNLKKHFRSPRR